MWDFRRPSSILVLGYTQVCTRSLLTDFLPQTRPRTHRNHKPTTNAPMWRLLLLDDDKGTDVDDKRALSDWNHRGSAVPEC